MSKLTEERLNEIEADPIEACLTDNEIIELIAAARANAKLVGALKWFAYPENWHEEELCDGIYFSAEWKLGSDPRAIAMRALAAAGVKP